MGNEGKVENPNKPKQDTVILLIYAKPTEIKAARSFVVKIRRKDKMEYKNYTKVKYQINRYDPELAKVSIYKIKNVLKEGNTIYFYNEDICIASFYNTKTKGFYLYSYGLKMWKPTSFYNVEFE